MPADRRNTRSGTLKLGHINIRSLPSKLDEIRLILRDNNIDILCVSETWLTEPISSDILIFPGYQVLRRDRAQPKRGRRDVRGGGLAVLVRDGVDVSDMKVSSPTESRLESLWLTVSSSGGRSAVIGAIYRPPDGRLCQDLDALRHQLLDVIGTGKPVYFLGDLNIDLLRPREARDGAVLGPAD